MKNYIISADTILIIITSLLIFIGWIVVNDIKDTQDAITRISVIEEKINCREVLDYVKGREKGTERTENEA